MSRTRERFYLIMKNQSLAWWSSLSITQMRNCAKKYYPDIRFQIINVLGSFINDIWEKEGKPNPQECMSWKEAVKFIDNRIQT